jgi:hypothetical protein
MTTHVESASSLVIPNISKVQVRAIGSIFLLLKPWNELRSLISTRKEVQLEVVLMPYIYLCTLSHKVSYEES